MARELLASTDIQEMENDTNWIQADDNGSYFLFFQY